MGLKWFIGGILVMSVVTYVMAVYVTRVLEFLKWPPPVKGQPLGNGPLFRTWLKSWWIHRGDMREARKKMVLPWNIWRWLIYEVPHRIRTVVWKGEKGDKGDEGDESDGSLSV